MDTKMTASSRLKDEGKKTSNACSQTKESSISTTEKPWWNKVTKGEGGIMLPFQCIGYPYYFSIILLEAD